jgi:hypothetical protein
MDTKNEKSQIFCQPQDVSAYFENLHEIIIGELKSARKSITAAVAWFTDREILDVLCRCAHQGVNVQVAMNDDQINSPPRAPNYHRLTALGGKIFRISSGSRNETLMHHKFCVIDDATVITGSYNWTRRARENDENITIVRGCSEFAFRFLATFDTIVGRQSGEIPPVDIGQVRKRLELIRNLILLDEIAEIDPHVAKLRMISSSAKIDGVLAAIQQRSYEIALEQIAHWLARANALVVAEDLEVPHLQLRLQVLELELEALSAELADLERRLVIFNRRHDDALGELIAQVLLLRAELARLQVEHVQVDEVERAEEAARSAETQFKDYTREHERLQESPTPSMLDDASEIELKKLYRKCSQICHPDKVPDEQKDLANETFLALQNAYKTQDLQQVRKISQMLASGNAWQKPLSGTLFKVDKLGAAIAQLNQRISECLRDLKALKQSEAVRMMNRCWSSEDVWLVYVDRRRHELEKEIRDLQIAILAINQ